MNPLTVLKRLLLARFEIQAAIGTTFAFAALLVDGIDPEIALGIVGVMFAWMGVLSLVAFGKSLDELDAAAEERATEKIQAAVAKQIPNETIEGRQSLSSLVNGLLEK